MNASKLVRGFGRRFVSLLRRNGRARQYSRLNVESLEERLVPYSFPLMNSTGLDPSQYTVQVLGYSVASQLELLPSATMGQLQWSAFPASLTLPEPTTNGSTTITMSGLNPDVYVTVGSAVSGTGIQAATTVTKITETVTLSQDASGSGTNPLTFNVLSLVGGSATMGSPTIMSLAPPPSTSSLRVGELISGQGIPPGTTVAAVNSNSELTLSQNAQSDETYTGQSPLTLSEQLSGTMNGTDKVTLTGLEASNEIAANDPVSGTNIQANTTVSQIDSVTITLSNGATVTATNPLTFTAQQMGTWIGDTITGISTTSLGVGYSVTGGSIPAGTTITQVNSSSEVTISRSAAELQLLHGDVSAGVGGHPQLRHQPVHVVQLRSERADRRTEWGTGLLLRHPGWLAGHVHAGRLRRPADQPARVCLHLVGDRLRRAATQQSAQ